MPLPVQPQLRGFRRLGELFFGESQFLGEDLPLLRLDPALGDRHLQRDLVSGIQQHSQGSLRRQLSTQAETSRLEFCRGFRLACRNRAEGASGFDDALLHQEVTDLLDAGVLRDNNDDLVFPIAHVVSLGAPLNPSIMRFVHDKPAATHKHDQRQQNSESAASVIADLAPVRLAVVVDEGGAQRSSCCSCSPAARPDAVSRSSARCRISTAAA